MRRRSDCPNLDAIQEFYGEEFKKLFIIKTALFVEKTVN